jgi:hypothetical protein
MSLADRFRREDVSVAHSHSKKKARVGRGPGSRLRLLSSPASAELDAALKSVKSPHERP